MTHEKDLDTLTDDERTTALLLLDAFESVHYSRPAPQANGLAQKNRSVVSRWAVAMIAASVSVIAASGFLFASATLTPAWASHPRTPSGSDTAAIESVCRQRMTLQSRSGGPTGSISNLPPLVLIDIRGSGALAVFQDSSNTVECIASNATTPFWFSLSKNTWSVASLTSGPGVSVAPVSDITIDSGAVSVEIWTDGAATRRSKYVTDVNGRVPNPVARVTADLPDGTQATASLAGNHFALWWPGDHAQQQVTLHAYDAAGSQIATLTTQLK